MAQRIATKNVAANRATAAARAAILAAAARNSASPKTVNMETALLRRHPSILTHCQGCLSTTEAILRTDFVVLTMKTRSVMSPGDSAARARESAVWGRSFVVQGVCLRMETVRVLLFQHQHQSLGT